MIDKIKTFMNEFQFNSLIELQRDKTKTFRILCLVSGNYHWLINPYLYLHNKYWGEPITFVSDRFFDTTDGHRVEPLEYTDFKEHGIGKQIKTIVDKFNEEYFVLSLPDYWICEPVNRLSIHKLCSVMDNYPNMARVNLEKDNCSDHWGVTFQKEREFWITRISQHNQHCGTLGGTAMLLGMWQRDFY